MSKYIDADKLRDGVMQFVNEYGEIVGMFVNDFNILLERCAADVAEVRHGRWKYKPAPTNALFGFYICSECGAASWASSSPYCPNCGASMMDEVEDNG